MRLSRRSFLRSLSAAGTTIWLPTLDAMLDDGGRAYASGEPIAKRFIEFFWGCSYTPLGKDRTWAPRQGSGPLPDDLGPCFLTDDRYQAKLMGLVDRGEDGLRKEHLTPSLSDPEIRRYIRIVDAVTTRRVVSDAGQHWQALLGVVTLPKDGAKYFSKDGIDAKGPTLDRFIGSYGRFSKGIAPHVHLGAIPVKNQGGISLGGKEHRTSVGWTTMSEGKIAPGGQFVREQAQWDRLLAFEEMFGKDGSDGGPRRRRSVLDGVLGASRTSLARLGARDRQMVDLHLDSIRQLEKNLVEARTCARPGAPHTARVLQDEGLAYTQENSNRTAPRTAKEMRDLATLMIKCDYTRCLCFCLFPALSGFDCTSFIDMSSATGPRAMPSIHRDSHDAKPYHRLSLPWTMGQLAALIQQLAQTPEGAGTALDSTLIWATSEHGPQMHSLDDIASILVGGPKLVGGNHLDTASTQRPISDLHLGILQALGLPLTEYLAWMKPDQPQPIGLL